MASARAASHVFPFVLPCVPDCWAHQQLAGQVLQQAVGQPQVAQLRMNCFRDMHRADEDSEIAALCFVAYMCKDDEMITKKALTVYIVVFSDMVFDARKWGVGAETNMRVLAMVDKGKTDRG